MRGGDDVGGRRDGGCRAACHRFVVRTADGTCDRRLPFAPQETFQLAYRQRAFLLMVGGDARKCGDGQAAHQFVVARSEDGDLFGNAQIERLADGEDIEGGDVLRGEDGHWLGGRAAITARNYRRLKAVRTSRGMA